MTIDYDLVEDGAPATVVVKLPASIKEGGLCRIDARLRARDPLLPRGGTAHADPGAAHVRHDHGAGRQRLRPGHGRPEGTYRRRSGGRHEPGAGAGRRADHRTAARPVVGRRPPAGAAVGAGRRAAVGDAVPHARGDPHGLAAFLETFGDALPPGGRALGERIIRHLDGILAAFVTGTPHPRPFRLPGRQPVHRRPDAGGPGRRGRLAAHDVGSGCLRRGPPGGWQHSAGGAGGHHEEIVECWHRGLTAGGVTDYSRDEAWRDYRLGAIMATLNPVLVHYMFKTGGERGTALGAAMTERLFCDLVECGAEAVVP